MNEPMIMPVKPGSLSKEDKDNLISIGVVVIEHEDPTSIRLIAPLLELKSNDLLKIAMRALMTGGNTQTARLNFFDLFSKLILKQGE